MYEISFTVTPLGVTNDGESRYMVVNTSTINNSPQIAVVVNETIKDLLMYLNQFWNNHCTAILKCIKNHYRTIISMVHTFETEASESDTPSSFAQTPLVGAPTSIGLNADDENLTDIKYTKSGEAARLLNVTISNEYVDAYNAIVTDYTSYPSLWYYVLNKYNSIFVKHVEQKEEL